MECKSGYHFIKDKPRCEPISDGVNKPNLSPEEITLLSLNAGNASPLCAFYNYKLCLRGAESKARDRFISKYNPDIILFQELWNGQCNQISNISQKDECVARGMNSLDEQIHRLLGYNISKKLGFSPTYDHRCAPVERGAYECIAINQNKLKFVEDSAAVRSIPEQIKKLDKNGSYCAEDGKKGKDTGFLQPQLDLQTITFLLLILMFGMLILRHLWPLSKNFQQPITFAVRNSLLCSLKLLRNIRHACW